MSPPLPAVTPPAHVAQLERSVEQLYARHRDLESLVGANHLALAHSVGQLAKALEILDRNVRAIAEKLGVGL